MFEFFLEIERTWPSSILFEKGTNVRVPFFEKMAEFRFFLERTGVFSFFWKKMAESELFIEK